MEKTYLRSFMQFFSTNSLSWEQLSYEEGEIRNLHYGLIHGFLTRGINSASLPMIKMKQYLSSIHYAKLEMLLLQMLQKILAK